ncbi:MAG: bacteriophage Gp15 family protein [Oscillospiraceae bacterium]|nr:bacteriophage Gp15 family protein [Oscillospiraceae bacterium]
MMNLLYEELPDSVIVAGNSYPIYTDFREWLKFYDLQEESALSQDEKALLMLTRYRKNPPITYIQEALEALVKFAVRDKISNNSKNASTKSTDKILSWSYDSPYIYTAFLSVYGIDLLQIQNMHWYIFLSLFDGLPEDTPIKQRMSYRAVNLSSIKDKNERKRIRKIKQAVKIPTGKLTAYQTGDFFG